MPLPGIESSLAFNPTQSSKNYEQVFTVLELGIAANSLSLSVEPLDEANTEDSVGLRYNRTWSRAKGADRSIKNIFFHAKVRLLTKIRVLWVVAPCSVANVSEAPAAPIIRETSPGPSQSLP